MSINKINFDGVEIDLPSTSGGGGGVTQETDPTVPQYVKDITEQNIQDWNNTVKQTEYSQAQTFPDGSDGGVVGRLYMRFRDDTENSVVANCQSVKYTVPVRDATANFYVGDPIQILHCTNKRYVDNLFNGANKAVSFVNYSSMITSLNALEKTSYSVGQNIMIVTLQVPDLWVSEVAEESVAYTYVSDDDFVTELSANGSVQVGYYKLSALETQKVDLTEYAKLGQLDTKLNKVTAETTAPQVYAKDINGSQTMLNVVSSTYTANTIAQRSATGTIHTADPQWGNEATNKRYVDTALAEKVDKPTLTTNQQVVTVKPDGTAEGISLASNSSASIFGAIPRYINPAYDEANVAPNNMGNLVSADPTKPLHCMNVRSVSVTGTTAPTEATKALYVGQIYIDTTNNKSYQCTAIDTTNNKYTWTQIIRATDYAGNSVKGVVDVRRAFGLDIDKYARIQVSKATNDEITAKTSDYHPIVPSSVDFAVKTGLTTNTIELTDEEKAKAKEWLGIDADYDVIISNQTEFEDFYTSLDDGTCTAESVLFVGNGGSAYFIREDGKGLRIPTSLKTISGKNNAKIRIDNFVYSSDSQAGIYYDALNSSMDYKIQNLQIEVSSSTTNSICAKNCSNISNCAFYAYQYSSLYSYAVYCCNNLIDCMAYADTRANKNGVYAGTAYGVYETNNLTRCAFYAYGGTVVAGAEGGSNYYNCKSSVSGSSSNAETYGYYYSEYLFGCTSEINSGKICRGFELCYYLFGCYSTIKVQGEYNYGYSQCSYPVTCLVYTSGTNYEKKQYNNCYHINATMDDMPSDYVNLSSAQTVDGNKTFTGAIIVPDVTIT